MKISMCTVLLLIIGWTASGQDRFALKQIKATVNGTSSLHDWQSDITKVAWKGDTRHEPNHAIEIRDVEVTIPVASIKSKEGKIMDNKTWEAFQSDKHPNIHFTADKANVDIVSTTRFNLQATGQLTMAGTTRAISLEGKGVVLPNGDISISISHKLKMTDYKMKPPTAVLGTIKVGDEVTVMFEIILTPAR